MRARWHACFSSPSAGAPWRSGSSASPCPACRRRPFLLVAAFGFGKASPGLRNWLVHHPAVRPADPRLGRARRHFAPDQDKERDRYGGGRGDQPDARRTRLGAHGARVRHRDRGRFRAHPTELKSPVANACKTSAKGRFRTGRTGQVGHPDREAQPECPMFLSVFDMFKIGIGPSSSHTMGPMVAAGRFLDKLRATAFTVHGLRAALYGSLAHTGVGHATDRAVILGLAGFLARRLRRRGRRSGARADPRHRTGVAARACRRSPSPQTAIWSSTRARRCPATPTGCELMATRRPGRRDRAGDLLFHRRRLRGDRSRTGGRSQRATRPIASAHPYPFETAERDARDGARERQVHRRDETRQRTPTTAARPRSPTGSPGSGRRCRPASTAASMARASCPAGSGSSAAPGRSTRDSRKRPGSTSPRRISPTNGCRSTRWR